MNKSVFISNGGLGDNVMLTPSLEKYKKINPDTEIHVATLSRFGKTASDLFDGLGYIVHPILSDPWDINFEKGMLRNTEEGKILGKEIGTDDVYLCHAPHGHKDWRMHKIYRFSKFLGIDLKGSEFKTKLKLDSESKKNALELCQFKEFIVVHLTPGNTRKNVSDSMLLKIKEYCTRKEHEGSIIFEIGSEFLYNSIKIGLYDMKLTKALVALATEVIAIDSVVMHIAGAFRTPLCTLWTITPVHQALPFWMSYENLQVLSENKGITLSNEWEQRRLEALKALEFKC